MSDSTPEWIRELTHAERNQLDNGIHPICFQQDRLTSKRHFFRQSADRLREEESPSSLVLAEQLDARVELLSDEIGMIERRRTEWSTWRPHNRDCIHGVVRAVGCTPCMMRRAMIGDSP